MFQGVFNMKLSKYIEEEVKNHPKGNLWLLQIPKGIYELNSLVVSDLQRSGIQSDSLKLVLKNPDKYPFITESVRKNITKLADRWDGFR